MSRLTRRGSGLTLAVDTIRVKGVAMKLLLEDCPNCGHYRDEFGGPCSLASGECDCACPAIPRKSLGQYAYEEVRGDAGAAAQRELEYFEATGKWPDDI